MEKQNANETSEIVITEYNEFLVTAEFKNDKINSIDLTEKKNASAVGNIYIGKVKDVVKNINAAFIEYQNGEKGYFDLNNNPLPVFLNNKNNNKVCQGDEVLIQIAKERVKTKDPVLTSKLEISGKYAVLTVGNTAIGFSNKFTDIDKKNNLLSMLKSYKNSEYGFIIRTNAVYVDENTVLEEIEALKNRYIEILNNAKYRTCYSLLYEKEKSYRAYIRDLYKDKDVIITDIKDVYEDICSDENINIELYKSELQPLIKKYSIEHNLQEILIEKVWLKSGAYLIIQPTEALTVIDVNTGKCIKGKATDEVFRKVNLESAVEIARQIRLRNISGIIIIDFINMNDQSFNDELLEEMRKLVRRDSVKTNVIDFTGLGLMELTRKKIKPPIYEMMAKNR